MIKTLNNYTLFGWAILLGSIFAFLGNILHPNLPEENSLNVVTFSNLILANQNLWFASHIILFTAILLLLFGFIGICDSLAKEKENIWVIPANLSFGFWGIFNAMTIIIDGFVFADLAIKFNASISSVVELFRFLHFIVLNTLSFSLFFWVMGFVFLGLGLLNSHLLNRNIPWPRLFNRK